MARIAAAILLLSVSMVSAGAQQQDPLTQRGQALVTEMCAECHATGRTGQSPHVGAPAFRTLERRVDLDTFVDRLRQGLTSGHPDMPTFRFTREDARAVVAYLRSIQAQ